MALIQLNEVGKIYVSTNAIAVGIRRVNASFDIGEFVAVTGKSGCGKTTLLNVISGLDTYEEGDLLINGSSTSHFIASDWEEYRKQYISFVFQDYNIIESFTVLENIEFALTHIPCLKERRVRAKKLASKVGLANMLNQKGSKLSGGQKQRTVIARALAKDSPIILADEPTGNLDSQAAQDIIALFGEISKEKLVIVVTHNAEELDGYATRYIRIFDGEISSDETVDPNYLNKAIQTNNTNCESQATEGALGSDLIVEELKLTAAINSAKKHVAEIVQKMKTSNSARIKQKKSSNEVATFEYVAKSQAEEKKLHEQKYENSFVELASFENENKSENKKLLEIKTKVATAAKSIGSKAKAKTTAAIKYNQKNSTHANQKEDLQLQSVTDVKTLTESDATIANKAARKEKNKERLESNKEAAKVAYGKAKVIAIKKAAITKESINLGFNRYLAMPKLTAFISFMCVVATLGLLLITSLLTTLGGDQVNTDLFKYEDGRLIVATADRQSASEQEIKAIASKFGVEYRTRDSLSDINSVFCSILDSDGTNNYSIYDDYSFSKYNNESLSYGVAPMAADEVIIKVSYANKSQIIESGIISKSISIFDYNYKITGCVFQLDNSIKSEVCFSEKAYAETYKRAIVDKQIGSLTSDEGANGNNSTIMISPKLKGTESFEYAGSQVNYDAKSLKYGDNTYQSTAVAAFEEDVFDEYMIIDHDRTINNEIAYLSATYISNELAMQIVAGSDYQFSLLFSSDKKASESMEELTAMGYNVSLSSAQAVKPKVLLTEKLKSVLIVVMWIISVVFIGLFVGLSTTKVHRSQKKDLAIFRTMGVDSRVIKKSIFWYNVIALIPCMIISSILFSLLFFSSAAAVLSYLSVGVYFLVFIGLLGVMAVATKLTNRQLFKQTVRGNLKGGRGK